jgi:hypothetical protein
MPKEDFLCLKILTNSSITTVLIKDMLPWDTILMLIIHLVVQAVMEVKIWVVTVGHLHRITAIIQVNNLSIQINLKAIKCHNMEVLMEVGICSSKSINKAVIIILIHNSH